MDKLEKELQKLSPKERDLIKDILEKLLNKNFKGFDVKKLKGRDDIFRLRKGKLRIIYRVQNNQIFILAIERRSEKTYRI